MSHKIIINYKVKKSNLHQRSSGKHLIYTIKVKWGKHLYSGATWEKDVRAENSFCVVSAKNDNLNLNHEEKQANEIEGHSKK